MVDNVVVYGGKGDLGRGLSVAEPPRVSALEARPVPDIVTDGIRYLPP
jgi:hypothetical protein